MDSVTRPLAGFVSSLSFDDLKPELVESFKKYLLDAIGCGLHGASQPWARIVNRWVEVHGGKKESILWRQGFQGPCAGVALGLGVMIHSFDFDDYHTAKIHPGATVIPAAMAVGKSIGASGRKVLTAMAAGYETMIRVKTAASVVLQCGFEYRWKTSVISFGCWHKAVCCRREFRMCWN